MTKKLLTAVVLASIVTAPALAAQRVHRTDDGQAVPQGYAWSHSPDVVVEGNRVIGRDPDLNIRSQIIRDSHSSDY